MMDRWTMEMDRGDYIMGENLHKKGIEKYYRERLKKIYCSTRKNITTEIAYPSKNLLLGLEFNL